MFQAANPQPKIQSRRPKVLIEDYTPDENDKKLRQWLDGWRWEISRDIHGVENFGCLNFMTGHLLQRICDAAHHNLINSTEDLYKETGWHFTDEYGQTVVDKIKEITPIAPQPSKIATVRKCSKYGQPGHTSELFTTPLFFPYSGDLQTPERWQHCPKYSPVESEAPNRRAVGAHPGDPSSVSFCVEPIPVEPGLSLQTEHYPRKST